MATENILYFDIRFLFCVSVQSIMGATDILGRAIFPLYLRDTAVFEVFVFMVILRHFRTF
jgi:hypothetical protein